MLRFNGKRTRAHRVAWELAHGKRLGDLIARHSCDNPPCCNPAHVLAGTRGDNVADKVARNRQARGETLARDKRGDLNPSRRRPDRLARGERHGMSKLSASEVSRIKTMIANGQSNADIGARFAVARQTIHDIRSGRTWARIRKDHA